MGESNTPLLITNQLLYQLTNQAYIDKNKKDIILANILISDVIFFYNSILILIYLQYISDCLLILRGNPLHKYHTYIELRLVFNSIKPY